MEGFILQAWKASRFARLETQGYERTSSISPEENVGRKHERELHRGHKICVEEMFVLFVCQASISESIIFLEAPSHNARAGLLRLVLLSLNIISSVGARGQQ